MIFCDIQRRDASTSVEAIQKTDTAVKIQTILQEGKANLSK